MAKQSIRIQAAADEATCPGAFFAFDFFLSIRLDPRGNYQTRTRIQVICGHESIEYRGNVAFSVLSCRIRTKTVISPLRVPGSNCSAIRQSVKK